MILKKVFAEHQGTLRGQNEILKKVLTEPQTVKMTKKDDSSDEYFLTKIRTSKFSHFKREIRTIFCHRIKNDQLDILR